MPASAKVRRRAVMAMRPVRVSTGMIAAAAARSDPYTPRGDRGDRGDARPAARFPDRKFGDKKPTPRAEVA